MKGDRDKQCVLRRVTRREIFRQSFLIMRIHLIIYLIFFTNE